jgi:predicted transcriptional regulator
MGGPRVNRELVRRLAVAGLTNLEIARTVGCSSVAVSYVLKGVTRPPRRRLSSTAFTPETARAAGKAGTGASKRRNVDYRALGRKGAEAKKRRTQ